MNTDRQWNFLTGLSLVVALLISPALANDCDERAPSNTMLFATKVQESPMILIGTSLNKNLETTVRNLFNVTFLVECILKGPPTQRIIHIVQAGKTRWEEGARTLPRSFVGSLLGRRSCQRLNANRQYIVFLEPFFDGTYRPVDFEEVPYSRQLNIVLEKTCGLSRTYPFTEANDTEALLTNRCPPAVSADCPTGRQTLVYLEWCRKSFPFVETSKTTLVSTTGVSPRTTTTITTTATKTISTTPSMNIFGNNAIDLAAISQFLANHPQSNLTMAFLQGQNHKALFSDDEARKNGTSRSLNCLFIRCLQWILSSLLLSRSF
jgi:hypothetical protein